VSHVTYRPYRKADAERAKQLINQAFFIHRYTGGEGPLLATALEVDLRQSLSHSSFAEVAELDGKVVGVLMGRVVGQPHLPPHRANMLRLWFTVAKMRIIGRHQTNGVSQFFAFSKAYKKLMKQAVAERGPLGSEITVFAVDSAMRGAGVGKHLYRDFCAQLKQSENSKFYLFTDTLCSFEFYEKQGMERAASTPMKMNLTDMPSEIGIYLYAGEVPN